MNKILKISLLVLSLITIISTASYCSAPYDTETAHIITVKKTISSSGYILRKETLVEAESGGIFEPSVANGDRVAKSSTIGVVTTGDLDEDLAARLEEVTARINELKEADSIADIYASDEARIYAAMKQVTASIRSSTAEGDFFTAAEETSKLAVLVEKKNSVETAGAADELLVSLEAEKYDIEQKIGGVRQNVLAPSSGYFFTATDGLEGSGKESDLLLVTNSKIKNFETKLKNHTPAASEIGKITDSYEWYLVMSMPNEDAETLTPGAAVTVSVDDSVFVDATVLTVNADTSDKSAVVIKSTRNIPGIYEKRTGQFEICLAEYSGLYVPAAAIRVQNGVTGVYVMNRTNEIVFGCVDILFEEESYCIVRTEYTPPEDIPYEPLRTYDNILVNPEVSDIDSKSSKKP